MSYVLKWNTRPRERFNPWTDLTATILTISKAQEASGKGITFANKNSELLFSGCSGSNRETYVERAYPHLPWRIRWGGSSQWPSPPRSAGCSLMLRDRSFGMCAQNHQAQPPCSTLPPRDVKGRGISKKESRVSTWLRTTHSRARHCGVCDSWFLVTPALPRSAR